MCVCERVDDLIASTHLEGMHAGSHDVFGFQAAYTYVINEDEAFTQCQAYPTQKAVRL